MFSDRNHGETSFLPSFSISPMISIFNKHNVTNIDIDYIEFIIKFNIFAKYYFFQLCIFSFCLLVLEYVLVRKLLGETKTI
jgi:hypothetical protein